MQAMSESYIYRPDLVTSKTPGPYYVHASDTQGLGHSTKGKITCIITIAHGYKIKTIQGCHLLIKVSLEC